MPVYKGNTKLKEIWMGGIRIDKIYKGSQLVYRRSPYKPGQVLLTETSNTGEKYITIAVDSILKIECVGGGSGGNGQYFGAIGVLQYGGGGSGAGFVGNMKIPAGNYKYCCGNGGGGNGGGGQPSYFLKVGEPFNGQGIHSGGGASGRYTQESGNAGGILSIQNNWISGNPQVKTNGNKGQDGRGSYSAIPGGPSVYGGYGVGGSSTGSGGNGFIKVTVIE